MDPILRKKQLFWFRGFPFEFLFKRLDNLACTDLTDSLLSDFLLGRFSAKCTYRHFHITILNKRFLCI